MPKPNKMPKLVPLSSDELTVPNNPDFDETDVLDGVLIGSNKHDDIDLSGYETLLEPMGVMVIAGNGNDFVWGSLYDDTIDGGNGEDVLVGDEGNDSISGGNGTDALYGGEGDDMLDGGNGKDVLVGDEGNDTLIGGNGKDALYGGEDDDILDGGSSKDRLEGGTDNGTFGATLNEDMVTYTVDTLVFGDDLTGGSSKDEFVYNAGDGVDVIRDYEKGDKVTLVGISEDDVVIFDDGLGNTIIAFDDTTTEEEGDLLADSAIVLEGVTGVEVDDLNFI